MEINIANIEAMGGCVHLPFEPNTPDIPELDGEVVVESMLFDGYGLFTHNGKYYKISYAKLEDVKDDEQVRRTINQHRAGYRLPDDFEVTVDDMALTFGEIEECEHSEYVSYIVEGLIENASRMNVEDGERDVLPLDEYCKKLREIEKCPPKYLYLFEDRDHLVELFDGRIYCIHDENCNYLCDLLEDDMLRFVDEGILIPAYGDDDINETKLSLPTHKEQVLSTRFEAIIFLKDKTDKRW